MTISPMTLFPKNIYHYKKPNNEDGICVYICDTDNSNEIIVGCIEDIDPLNNDYIKMTNGLNKVLYLDRYLTLKSKSIISPLFVKRQHLSISSKEFQLLTTNIYKLLLLKYQNQVNNTACENFEDDSLVDIGMPEEIIKLLTWNTKKINLKFKNIHSKLIIMEHCIYFAYCGTNIGSEINKLRPVVVWRKHENKENHNDDAYFVFPMSSKRSKSIYKQNVQLNIDNKHNKVMVNQGRLLSRKRFVKIYKDLNTDKVYKLSEEEINKIKEAIKFYFGV